jgi:hypothetical protein
MSIKAIVEPLDPSNKPLNSEKPNSSIVTNACLMQNSKFLIIFRKYAYRPRTHGNRISART